MQHNTKEVKRISKISYILVTLILISCALFLTLGIKSGNLDYALSQRIPKLIAIILTGGAIAFSTVIFQTVVDNHILTPSVMGLDSLYVLIQSTIVFLLGTSSVFIVNKKINFAICVVFMILGSLLIYKIIFKRGKGNIIFLLLIGMVCGTLFKSLSTFMQMAIDPNEYLTLQNKLFASFNNVNVDILMFAVIIIILMIPFIYDDIKYLDVMSLGRDHAINLGVQYDKLVKKFLVIVSVLVAISTALVGPLTFLGLLVVNLTRQIAKTYKHKYLILLSILVSIFTLVFGQLLAERVLKFSTPVSVIINLVGGIYFMYLLYKESKV